MLFINDIFCPFYSHKVGTFTQHYSIPCPLDKQLDLSMGHRVHPIHTTWCSRDSKQVLKVSPARLCLQIRTLSNPRASFQSRNIPFSEETVHFNSHLRWMECERTGAKTLPIKEPSLCSCLKTTVCLYRTTEMSACPVFRWCCFIDQWYERYGLAQMCSIVYRQCMNREVKPTAGEA